MQRFMLFAGECFYASGGFHDWVGSFETLEDAVRCAESKVKLYIGSDVESDAFEWWHIFDQKQQIVVRHSPQQAFGAPDDCPKLDA